MSGVVVAHPGRQYVYETVLAAQAAGLLQAFATGFNLDAGGPLPRAARLVLRLPGLDARLSGARTATDPRIDARTVVAFPLSIGLARMARRTSWGWHAERWGERVVDRRIARWLSRLDPAPEIVHVFEGASLETLRAARRRGATTVLDVPSAHEELLGVLEAEGVPLDSSAHTARVQAERALADRLVVPSERVRRFLESRGVERERIACIPFGIEPSDFDASPRVPDGRFRVLYLGKVGAHKGVEYLLRAWSQAALPGAELVLVGDLSYRGAELLSAQAGSCTWMGRVARDRVAAEYARADVVVAPSLSEGSSLVVHEAMASGRPVVGTSIASPLIEHDATGLVVPPRDAEALAAALRELAADPQRCAALGRRAREHVEANFTPGHYRRNLAALYEELTAERRRGLLLEVQAS